MFNFERDSIANVIFITIVVCLACSMMVSAAVVVLKPQQQLSKERDRKVNVLLAAGALEDSKATDPEINRLFSMFEAKVVDLKTGKYVDDIDAATFDQLKAAKDHARSRVLSDDEDIATLKRLENRAVVYLQRDTEGKLEKLVLPVRGYGLWGTLYGFLALNGDLSTIAGLGFYKQQETPGLGGEVDNPKWKALWPGVQLFDAKGEPAVHLVKTRSPEGADAASHEVDALAGATLTTRGVQNLVNFWAGNLGFGPYLSQLRAGA